MNWENVTIEDFQDLHTIGNNKTLDEIERACQAISVLFKIDAEAVDSLSLDKFNEMAAVCARVLSGDIQGKANKYIEINNKRFTLQYDVFKLTRGQYAEIKRYSEKPIENMHFIIAALVRPKRSFPYLKSECADRELLAGYLLKSRLIDAYPACVYFGNYFNKVITELETHHLSIV